MSKGALATRKILVLFPSHLEIMSCITVLLDDFYVDGNDGDDVEEEEAILAFIVHLSKRFKC